jgi:hypothetical protein
MLPAPTARRAPIETGFKLRVGSELTTIERLPVCNLCDHVWSECGGAPVRPSLQQTSCYVGRTGWSRPTGEAVPVLKELTTMMFGAGCEPVDCYSSTRTGSLRSCASPRTVLLASRSRSHSNVVQSLARNRLVFARPRIGSLHFDWRDCCLRCA